MTRLFPATRLLAIACVLSAGTHGVSAAEDRFTEDRSRIEALSVQLAGLSPSVKPAEAARVAAAAVAGARELRQEYRVVGPPLFHNFLVNSRMKKRGLCFQWTEDLMARIGSLQLRTLELHWADARATTWREHNSVVVTAKGQPFNRGLVLDAWRHSGRLFSAPVIADRYPWVEAKSLCRHAPRRTRATNVTPTRKS